ncbi:MAG TPA: c-type cytochrome [Deinococcales bacterium]|nr:c-type cytochrome [Deinococcales bacterium]
MRLLIVFTLLALTAPLRAAPVDAAAIVRQGNNRGAVACSECHDRNGRPRPTAVPQLAGLNAQYLRKQLDDFAGGSRDHPVMQPIARALSEDERAALARWYATQTAVAATDAPVNRKDNPDGERLALRGRWSAQVPACEQCHGPGGVGVGAHFPALAGQPADYLEAQLKAWQQGTRRNDPLALMQQVAKALDGQDITAVAAWFAALPPDGNRG